MSGEVKQVKIPKVDYAALSRELAAKNVTHTSLFIGEVKQMDYLSNRAMICLQKEVGGTDMTTERELIEDKIKERIAHFGNMASNKETTFFKANYANAICTQATILHQTFERRNKHDALLLITRICNAYRASDETEHRSTQTDDKQLKVTAL